MTFDRACQDVRDLLEMQAYGLLDDPASAADRTRLQTHLAGCASCGHALAEERAVTASLASAAKVRVSVSVEDRVMAAVRQAGVPSRAGGWLSPRQKTLLGGVAAAGAIAEAVGTAAVVVAILRIPALRALLTPFATADGLSRQALLACSTLLDVTLILGGIGLTILRSLALLLPPPEVLAVLFVSTVLFTTFVAVRRDLRRSRVPARGSR